MLCSVGVCAGLLDIALRNTVYVHRTVVVNGREWLQLLYRIRLCAKYNCDTNNRYSALLDLPMNIMITQHIS